MSAELAPYALDPFGPASNPAAYVACEASERARAALEEALEEGRVAALVGPPGHGKTLLLRLAGAREETRCEVVYIPFCTLEPDELFAWVLELLDRPTDADPREALLELTREFSARGGILLLTDDASAMPDETAAALASVVTDSGGTLRLGLAALEGPDAERVCRAFGTDIEIVTFADGMSEREARRYVETRLAYAGARPDLVAAFDEDTIEALHRTSRGIPRCLNQAAQDVVRRTSPGPLPRLRDLAPLPGGPVVARRPEPEPEPEPEPALEEGVGTEAGLEVEAAAPAAEAPREPTAAANLDPPSATAETAPSEVERPEVPTVEPAPEEAPPEEDQGILLEPLAPVEDELEDHVGEYRLVRGRLVDPRTWSLTQQREERIQQMKQPQRAAGSVQKGQREKADRDSDLHRYRAALGPDKNAVEPPPSASKLGAVAGLGFFIGVLLVLLLAFGDEIMEHAKGDQLSYESYRDRFNLPGLPQDDGGFARAPARPTVPVPRPAGSEPNPDAPGIQVPERAANRISEALARASEVLAPTPKVEISINARPWAIIEVDGRELGETPLARVALTPGMHQFRARMPDGSVRERTLDITPSRRTVVFE